MPNSKLSKSKIINYYYPEKELSVPVEVGIHYSSELDHVESVTLKVAREILVSPEWGVDDYETLVLFTGFGDSCIKASVMLRAKEYSNPRPDSRAQYCPGKCAVYRHGLKPEELPNPSNGTGRTML